MTVEHWLTFVAASAVLISIPGPTTVLSYALLQGRRVAVSTVSGVALGDLTALTASLLGLSAVLATSATLFTALKWIGAAYLVYLGIKLWQAPVGAREMDGSATDVSMARPFRIFLHTYLVTALNPKSVIFFVAFLPQFLDPSRPVLGQMIILEATFVVLASATATFYAMAASSARKTIRKPSVQRAVNRVGGSLMIGAGVLAAGWRRSDA